MKSRSTKYLGLSAALALALVGCGDDDSPADAGPDAEHDHDGGDHHHGGSGGKAGGGAGKGGAGGAGGRGGSSGGDDAGADDDAGTSDNAMSFFVTSSTPSKSGNLGGLKGADEICNNLAKAAGSKLTFKAYLSAEKDESGADATVHARDRIGNGPWYNAKGVMLAKDLAALHAIASGNADLFLTDKGAKVNGQWEGSPTPNEHDILTGSDAEGKLLAGKTCNAWTSDAETGASARLGHSDGLGPSRNPNPPYASWNSSHDSQGCSAAKLAATGGAGKFYCFAPNN